MHRAVQQTPNDPLTICGDRVRSCAEVADRVARLAGALRTLGVGAGDRVGMLALNSDRYLEYLLAVPWADAVLNPVNVRWNPAEIGSQLRDSGTAVLFVDDAFAPMIPALREAYDGSTTVVHCGDGPTPDGLPGYEDLIAGAQPIEDTRRGGDALAGLFYTGGTTGFPKGVMLSHANLITSALGTLSTGRWLRSDGRFLHAAPMFHLADISGLVGQLQLGGVHVVIPYFDPILVLQAIQEHRVTDVLLIPTMIQLLVDHPDIGRHDLSSLRCLPYGASPIPEALLDRAIKALPGVEFEQAYGMTELSPIATVLGPDDHGEPPRSHDRLRSAGRAAPHTEVRIMDADDREVPRGTVGEIVVRGGNVMLGYWNRPEETAAALRGGWLHTGDVAYMDDQVYVVDRIKDMIISGGENVYSAEVENAVADHPAVASCAVIGVPDPDWGERVHAVVVLAPGATLTAEELREHCKERIAGYKSPRSVEFVDALPLSGAAKVMKRELRKKHWEGTDRAVN